MIITRFGGEVEILEDTGEGWVKVRRKEDNAIREWHISELRADNGLSEIQEAIKEVSLGR